MPCYDPYNPEDDLRIERNRADRAEAMLCAIMTVVQDYGMVGEVLGRVDEKEAGVGKQEIGNWWDAHQEADRKRKATVARRKQEALAKLTPQERRILGLEK